MSCFGEIFFKWEQIFSFFHTVAWECLLHTAHFLIFCRKVVSAQKGLGPLLGPQRPTNVYRIHSVEKWEIFSHRKYTSSWNLFLNIWSCNNSVFMNFLPEKCESKFPEFPHCESLTQRMIMFFESWNNTSYCMFVILKYAKTTLTLSKLKALTFLLTRK